MGRCRASCIRLDGVSPHMRNLAGGSRGGGGAAAQQTALGPGVGSRSCGSVAAPARQRRLQNFAKPGARPSV